MTEPAQHDLPSRLQLFDEWFDARLRRPDGTAYSRRSKQQIAKAFRLPIVRVGHVRLIDPAAADARLLEHALHQDEPERPSRGRPRRV